MAFLVQKGIAQSQWNPCLQFVRFRKRINIQRPRAPHYERAKVLHVCRPFFPKPEEKPMAELCLRSIELVQKREKVENPFQTLMAKELLNWFNQSRMVLLFHENPIKADEQFKAKVLFKRQNMFYLQRSKNIAIPALEGTKYEAVLDLFSSPVALVFSSEPNVSKALKINKKVPELILLAGIVEDRLLSRNEVVKYSRLPDLETARAQLVGTLNSAVSQLVHNMTFHQQTLVGHLQKHIELQTPPDS